MASSRRRICARSAIADIVGAVLLLIAVDCSCLLVLFDVVGRAGWEGQEAGRQHAYRSGGYTVEADMATVSECTSLGIGPGKAW